MEEKKIFLAKYRESRNMKGKLTYLDRKKSLKLIQNKLVIDLEKNKETKIADFNL